MKSVRNLGLALIAALALAASTGAASAGAAGTGFLAKEYPATIEEVKPLATMVFSIGSMPGIECIQSGYNVSKMTEQTSLLYVDPAAEFTCSSGSFKNNVVLNSGNCAFTLSPAGEGSLGIGPVGCGSMDLYSKTLNCHWLMDPQAASPVSLAVEGSPSKVKTAADVVWTYHSSGGTCGKEGLIRLENVDWQLGAVGPFGSFTSLYLGNENGFFFNEAKGLFESEAKPLTVAGSQDPANKYALNVGSLPAVSCAAVDLKATVSASEYQVPGGTSTAQLPASASYAGCSIPLLGKVKPVAIEMNSCNYTLNGAGTVDIACKTAEDIIKVNFYNETIGGSTLCQYTIAPQKGLKGAKYGTVGSGADRGVSVALELSGIAINRTSGSPLTCGAASQTATHKGGTTLFGQ